MKVKNMMKLFGLSLFAIAGAAAVAVGSKEAPAKADSTYSIYLEFNNGNWRNGENKVAAYAFNDTLSKSKWGDFVVPSTHYIQYNFELDFEPEAIILAVATPSATETGDWLFDVDNSGLFGRTNDITWNKVAYVGNYYTSSKYCESGSYDYETYIKGGAYEGWTETTVSVKLDNAHINASGELEVYGDVTLEKCQFKAHETGAGDDGYYGRYKTQESIAANFSGGYTGDEGPSVVKGDNIVCEVAGKYQMYFHFYNKRLWIQMDATEEAKAYATSFLSTIKCVGGTTGGVNFSAQDWTDMGTAFAAMSEGARGFFAGDPTGRPTDIISTVERYDFIIMKYGTDVYADFMNRFDGEYNPATLSEFDASTSTNAIIIIAAVTSVLTLSIVIMIRVKAKKQK